MAPRAPPWRARRDLSGAILALFAVALCLLVVLPIGWLVVFAFTGRGGGFTLANFRLLFSDAAFLDPLLTTLTLAVSVSLICCLVAAPMGWIVARSDMPLRRTVRFVVMASFVTPPFLGAIACRTARRVTIPLALPALAAGALIAFLQAMTLFGAPGILALPAGFHTMTTKIWSLFQYPPKPELAAAASLPLLVVTVVLLRAQSAVLGRRGYAVVGGRGGEPRRVRLGPFRWPALAACLA